MKVAVIFDNGEVYVQFSPEKFLMLLKKYLEEYKDIDKAMAKIVEDIKKATLHK